MADDVGRRSGPARPSGGVTDDDARLLERLGTIVAVIDPVPDHLRAAAHALYAFRDPDAELMEAVAVDDGELEAVRGTVPTSRMHFFEFGDMSIDVELTTSGAFSGLLGMVADPGGTEGTSITVETPSASFTTAPDSDGRFSVSAVPVGLARLTLERPDRLRVTTPWFETG